MTSFWTAVTLTYLVGRFGALAWFWSCRKKLVQRYHGPTYSWKIARPILTWLMCCEADGCNFAGTTRRLPGSQWCFAGDLNDVSKQIKALWWCRFAGTSGQELVLNANYWLGWPPRSGGRLCLAQKGEKAKQEAHFSDFRGNPSLIRFVRLVVRWNGHSFALEALELISRIFLYPPCSIIWFETRNYQKTSWWM
jgi:hypothetical protein